MKTSARNHFSGTISTRSANDLGLAVGKPAQALIKASNVIVAVG